LKRFGMLQLTTDKRSRKRGEDVESISKTVTDDGNHRSKLNVLDGNVDTWLNDGFGGRL
jgi:hypothetical protein